MILSSVLHGGVMLYDAVVQEGAHAHLWGDVPLLFAAAALFGWLRPSPMESSIRTTGASGRGPLGRHEAHPFEEPPRDAEPELCALCGERRVHILHHPTRIRAACLLRGLDPDAVMRGQRS